MIWIRLFFLSVIVLVFGCTLSKEAPTPEEHSGLETIPFYRVDDLGFSTKEAIERLRREKQEEERRRTALTEGIKERIGEGEAVVFDPTEPPTTLRPADLPPALRGFPKDKFGYPDWTTAAERGLIKPKGTLLGGREEGAAFDEDILFEINDLLMADVRFPHETHTYWLSCDNCHPSIFKAKKGANQFNMEDVWKGDAEEEAIKKRLRLYLAPQKNFRLDSVCTL
jgi:c(7)-type cytochrome triheme protein